MYARYMRLQRELQRRDPEAGDGVKARPANEVSQRYS
jgi:hypothetical protein